MEANLASSGSLTEERIDSLMLLLPYLLAPLDDGGSIGVVGGPGGGSEESAVARIGCELESEKKREELRASKFLGSLGVQVDPVETLKPRLRSFDAMALTQDSGLETPIRWQRERNREREMVG